MAFIFTGSKRLGKYSSGNFVCQATEHFFINPVDYAPFSFTFRPKVMSLEIVKCRSISIYVRQFKYLDSKSVAIKKLALCRLQFGV